LGIVIACIIAYGKDKNNRLEYRFDEESRKNGKNMLIVSVCMLGVWIIVRILLSNK
jgi:multisubunit Na+/H+ antiporter MnhB subunit